MKLLGAVIAWLIAGILTTEAKIDWEKIREIEPKLPPQLLVKGKHVPGHSKITGGEEAQPHQFPYQAAILITTSEGTAFCGGSLISEEWVLTAAHCAEAGSSFEVILGAHNIREEEPTQVKIVTTERHIHPNWDPQLLSNDIALLKLPQAVTLNDNIQLIRLPTQNQVGDDFVNEDATVSGWGKDSDGASSISPVLRYVQIPVISNSDCNSYYFGVINDVHICASGDAGKSSCSGDSGGPLVIEDTDGEKTQIGLVSFGISLGCEIGWPSVFTRITEFLDFIESTTGIL